MSGWSVAPEADLFFCSELRERSLLIERRAEEAEWTFAVSRIRAAKPFIAYYNSSSLKHSSLTSHQELNQKCLQTLSVLHI